MPGTCQQRSVPECCGLAERYLCDSVRQVKDDLSAEQNHLVTRALRESLWRAAARCPPLLVVSAAAYPVPVPAAIAAVAIVWNLAHDLSAGLKRAARQGCGIGARPVTRA